MNVIPVSNIAGVAISEIALLDIHSGAQHEGVLALHVGSTWISARAVGRGARVYMLASSAVDVPGLQPPAVRVEVALESGTAAQERTFVCGVDGEGHAQCPVAVTTASTATSNVLSANVLGVLPVPAVWRAELLLSSRGFEARPVKGVLPSGLPGEHGFSVGL